MRLGKFLSAVGLVAAAWLGGQAPASAADVTSHYIDYQVDFHKMPPGAKGDGTWQYGAVAVCKMWKMSQIAAISLSLGSNQVSLVITQQGDESADGLTANYTVQVSQNGQQTPIRAALTFPGKNQPGKMDVTSGSTTATKAIPAGVLLQSAWTSAALDQLLAGKTDFTMQVVEPIADAGYEEIRVEVLSASPFGSTPLPADTSGALKGKSWFLKTTHKDGTSSQEVMMQLHESGVVSRLQASVSGIELEMTARSINVFPKPPC